MARVLCFGVTTVDLIFQVNKIPASPTKVLANNFIESSGGMAANAAIAIARLGGSASLWSRVGDDDRGRWLIDELTKNHVDTSAVRRIRNCQSTVSSILIGENGEKLVCPYFDDNMATDTSRLPLERLSDYDIILLDPRWPDAVEAVTDKARSLGVRTILDADTGDVDLLKELVPLVSNVVFSLPALEAMTEQQEVESGLKAIRSLICKDVGTTAGEKGFYWYDGNELTHVIPPVMNSVDTLAAGDVFHGAFCLALAEGMNITQAGKFATAAASLKCTTFGGIQGAPNRADVEALLVKN